MSNDNKLKPAKVKDLLSAERDKEIVRLLKREITGPNVQKTAYGWNIRSEGKGDGRVLAVNSSGFTAPAFGIAEIIDYDADKNKFILGRPTSVDDPNTVLIAGKDIPDTKEGYIWDNRSMHKVLAPGAVRDDIVGSQINSWEGAVSSSGTYLTRATSGGDVYVTPFNSSGTLSRVFIDEIAYVKSEDASSTFGYPNGAIARLLKVTAFTTNTWIAIFKFKSVIPFLDPEPDSGRKFVLLPQFAPSGLGAGAWRIIAPAGGISGTYDVTARPILIDEDFDISSVTYTSYQALAKGAAMQLLRPFDDMVPIPGGDSVTAGSPNTGMTFGDTRQGPAFLDNFFTGSIYGFALEIQSGPIAIDSIVDAGFQITRDASIWTNSFLEWHLV